MPKFLWQVRYTPTGAKGVIDEGGSGRQEMIEKLLSDHGGTLEAFYFAFGEKDAFVIADVPDEKTAAAIALRVSASGAASVETTVLIPPKEIDRAVKIAVAYRPPGE